MLKQGSIIVLVLAGLVAPIWYGPMTARAISEAQSRRRQPAPARESPARGADQFCDFAPCFIEQIKERLKCYMAAPANCEDCLKPGFAVAILMNDKVIFDGASGFANLESRRPVPITKNTVFDLASITKQFTAAGILMLIDDGVKVNGKPLSLNTRLSDIFEDFPAATGSTRISDLLTHQSNLRDYITIYDQQHPGILMRITRKARTSWYEKMEKRSDAITNDTVFKMIKDGGPEKREPGDDFIYSNSGYVVLAKIIEQLSGQTYKQFMNERIFKPLKMTNTTVFDERSGKIQNHAFPYGRDRQDYFAFDGYTPLNFIYGDGNIHSTLTDMIKWVGALDDVQHARRRALIKRNTLMEAFASQRLRSDLRRRLDYGFGFHVAQKGIIRVIYHGGDWPGFHSFMLYGRIEQPRQPACEITIIVLSNFEPDQNDPNQNRPCNLSKELSKVFWGQTKSSNIILDDVFCGSKPNSDCGKLPSCNGANLQPGD